MKLDWFRIINSGIKKASITDSFTLLLKIKMMIMNMKILIILKQDDDTDNIKDNDYNKTARNNDIQDT